MNIVSINSDDKKARYKMDYCILHKFLLVTILLYIFAIICHWSKKVLAHQQYKNRKKLMTTKFFDSIIMLRFDKTKVVKEFIVQRETYSNLGF